MPGVCFELHCQQALAQDMAKHVCCLAQAPSGHMRTVSVMAMKFTLVDSPQPVDAHLPQLMPGMLNHIQDQDR